jgi:2-methylisocitrate lyase-like PEP mutase family enzyme
MIAKGIIIYRLIEAAKAAQELGANLTVEPGGIAVSSGGATVTVTYEDLEHAPTNELAEAVARVTA